MYTLNLINITYRLNIKMIHFIFYFNLNSKFEIRTVLTLPHDKTRTISVIQYNNIYVSFILTGGREERAGCYIPSAIVTRQSYSKYGEFENHQIIYTMYLQYQCTNTGK